MFIGNFYLHRIPKAVLISNLQAELRSLDYGIEREKVSSLRSKLLLVIFAKFSNRVSMSKMEDFNQNVL